MRRIKRAADLTVQTTEQIRAAILRGDWSPGSRIRQEELASRLAVSRAPVRQALIVLQREGLIENDGRGMIVASLDATVIRDIYDFREGVERHVAETLARRSGLDWRSVEQIVESGRAAAAADDLSVRTPIDLDLRFHTALYDAVGNRILSEVMRGQWANMRRVMAATVTVEGYVRQIWDEHAAILAAIVARDVERAGALAAAHTRRASEQLVDFYRRSITASSPPAEAWA